MVEQTVVQVLDLPEGTDWVWFGDANIVGVARRLCPEGRDQALSDLQAEWRRSMIRVVA